MIRLKKKSEKKRIGRGKSACRQKRDQRRRKRRNMVWSRDENPSAFSEGESTNLGKQPRIPPEGKKVGSIEKCSNFWPRPAKSGRRRISRTCRKSRYPPEETSILKAVIEVSEWPGKVYIAGSTAQDHPPPKSPRQRKKGRQSHRRC